MSGERDTAWESEPGIEAEIERAIRSSRSQHRHHFAALWRMPPLRHWPDRTRPFEPEHSEVFAFIMRECGVGLELAKRIHGSAKERGVIRFDPETLLWRGVPPPWERYRKPGERRAIRRRENREAKARGAQVRVCKFCGEWFASRNALRAHVAEQRLIELGFEPLPEDIDA